MKTKLFTAFLALLCLALVSLLWLPYHPAEKERSLQADIDNSSKAQHTVPSANTMHSISDYSAFSAQPLFDPKRSPYVKSRPKPVNQIVAKPIKAAPVANTPLPNLIGIISVNKSKIAFVMGDNDPQAMGLKIGEQYKNWTLTAIGLNTITMAHNKKEHVITLDWAKLDKLRDYIGSSSQSGNDGQANYLGNVDEFDKLVPDSLKNRLIQQMQNTDL